MIDDLLLVSVIAAGLTSDQREAFIDSAYIGRTNREIAADMGCVPQNVGQLVERARKRLRGLDFVTDLRTAA